MKAEHQIDDDFGVCPRCKKYEDCLNISRNHWFVCHTHKVKWHFGSNIFSNWRYETEDDWKRNAKKIEDYHDITLVGANAHRQESTQ